MILLLAEFSPGRILNALQECPVGHGSKTVWCHLPSPHLPDPAFNEKMNASDEETVMHHLIQEWKLTPKPNTTHSLEENTDSGPDSFVSLMK